MLGLLAVALEKGLGLGAWALGIGLSVLSDGELRLLALGCLPHGISLWGLGRLGSSPLGFGLI